MRSWEDGPRPGAAARGLPESGRMVNLSPEVETGLPSPPETSRGSSRGARHLSKVRFHGFRKSKD